MKIDLKHLAIERRAVGKRDGDVASAWNRYHEEFESACNANRDRIAACRSNREQSQIELVVDLDIAQMRLEARVRLAEEELVAAVREQPK